MVELKEFLEKVNSLKVDKKDIWERNFDNWKKDKKYEKIKKNSKDYKRLQEIIKNIRKTGKAYCLDETNTVINLEGILIKNGIANPDEVINIRFTDFILHFFDFEEDYYKEMRDKLLSPSVKWILITQVPKNNNHGLIQSNIEKFISLIENHLEINKDINVVIQCNSKKWGIASDWSFVIEKRKELKKEKKIEI